MSARTRTSHRSTSTLSIVAMIVTPLFGLLAATPRDRAKTSMAGSDGLVLI